MDISRATVRNSEGFSKLVEDLAVEDIVVDDAPESYPCVVLWDIFTWSANDHQAEMIFVYPRDFE